MRIAACALGRDGGQDMRRLANGGVHRAMIGKGDIPRAARRAHLPRLGLHRSGYAPGGVAEAEDQQMGHRANLKIGRSREST